MINNTHYKTIPSSSVERVTVPFSSSAAKICVKFSLFQRNIIKLQKLSHFCVPLNTQYTYYILIPFLAYLTVSLFCHNTLVRVPHSHARAHARTSYIIAYIQTYPHMLLQLSSSNQADSTIIRHSLPNCSVPSILLVSTQPFTHLVCRFPFHYQVQIMSQHADDGYYSVNARNSYLEGLS